MKAGFKFDFIAFAICEFTLFLFLETKIESPSKILIFCESSFKVKVSNNLTVVSILPPPLEIVSCLMILIFERSADGVIPPLCLITS